MVAPALQTEGKSLQKSQGVGMGTELPRRCLTATDDDPDVRHRPRRRLRRPVRPADRPPGARGARLQRDRARTRSPRPRSRHASPAGVIFSGGPASVHVEGAPVIDPGGLRHRRARSSASATAPSSWPATSAARSPAPAGASTAAPSSTCRRRGASLFCGASPAAPAAVWMSHFDTITEAPDRRSRSPPPRPTRRRPRSRTSTAASTACSSTPRSCTRRTARSCSSTSSTTRAAAGRRGR